MSKSEIVNFSELPDSVLRVVSHALVAVCLACSLTIPASAQSGVDELPGSTPAQTPGLAASDRFPVTFLPFHQDWRIQTLAVPSRAVFAPSGFVALEWDPDPSLADLADKELSAAGPQLSYVLLSANRSRLFAVSLGGFRRLTVRDLQYESPRLSESESDRHAVDASLRYVAIRKTRGGAGQFVGFHGRYRDQFNKSTDLTAVRGSTDNDEIARSDSGSSSAINRALDRTISIGIEAGRSEDDLDIILDVTYHRALGENESTRSSFSVTDTRTLNPGPGDPDLSRRERTLTNLDEHSGRLNSVSGSAYLRRQSDVANRSVFFITNVVIGFGDAAGQTSSNSIERISEFLNDVRIGFEERRNDQTVPVDESSSSWLFRVGSGVELHRTYGALTASGGFAADIIASNYKNIPVRGIGTRLIVDSPFREARLTLPALAYIEVYRDIKIFGGAIFSASYSYDKESVLTPTSTDPDAPRIVTANTKATITGWYPVGILASHPSGFFLEAAFGGSLANYDNWRLTLGLDLDSR